jgi:hypothetical protein
VIVQEDTEDPIDDKPELTPQEQQDAIDRAVAREVAARGIPTRTPIVQQEVDKS